MQLFYENMKFVYRVAVCFVSGIVVQSVLALTIDFSALLYSVHVFTCCLKATQNLSNSHREGKEGEGIKLRQNK